MSEQMRKQLNKWCDKNLTLKPKNNKREDKLSQEDLRELMGTNRPTYRRGKGGAFKQK